MTNTTKTATNRRGNQMDGGAIIRDSKTSTKGNQTFSLREVKSIAANAALGTALACAVIALIFVWSFV